MAQPNLDFLYEGFEDGRSFPLVYFEGWTRVLEASKGITEEDGRSFSITRKRYCLNFYVFFC